jgi:hypothetical protein
MSDKAMLGRSGYERVTDDLYETPDWVTRVLLDHIKVERVWEPACGKGAMAKVMTAAGVDVAATDLREYGYGAKLDFLACHDETARDIVTNPPYSLADEFVRHALRLTATHHMWVAMLLRHEWDAGVTRDDILSPGGRYYAKIVLTDRPRWIAGTKERPRHNYAWYVWSGWPVLHPKLLRGR